MTIETYLINYAKEMAKCIKEFPIGNQIEELETHVKSCKFCPIYEKCGRYRAERRAYSSSKMCLEVLDNYIEVEQ